MSPPFTGIYPEKERMAMTYTLIIRKYAYLKRPVWKWYLENSLGGGFTNSGEYRTRKACLAHANAMIAVRDYRIVEETVTQ